MTLERLVAEIQGRGEQELRDEAQRFDAEQSKILAELDRRVKAIDAETRARAEAEAQREKVQRVAGARMQARKLEYEALERAMNRSLDGVRDLLRDFTGSDEYPETLKRMAALATAELGKDVRISGRAEDAAVLRSVAGRSFDPTPRAILGGLIAESPDGERRLILSFDELLRLREDRVRALLA